MTGSTAGWPFGWLQRAWDRLPWWVQVFAGPMIATAPLLALIAVPIWLDTAPA